MEEHLNGIVMGLGELIEMDDGGEQNRRLMVSSTPPAAAAAVVAHPQSQLCSNSSFLLLGRPLASPSSSRINLILNGIVIRGGKGVTANALCSLLI